MHALVEFACVLLGGALGAVIRHLVSGSLARLVGLSAWIAIIGVNTLGSILAGVLVGVQLPVESTFMNALLLVGVCGGLTTFSTAMLDAWVLMATGRRWLGFCCLFGTPLLAMGGILLGRMIGGVT